MDAVLVRQGSPTLQGLKTGSLFVCQPASQQDMTALFRRWNGLLRDKGLRVIPLKCGKRGVLCYLYRPAQLKNELTRPAVFGLLQETGYDRPASALTRLRRRLNESPEFPHEIGLFLGYPPEDVRGFITHRAKEFCYAGCWKVYGDPEKAKRRFSRFKECTTRCCRDFANGKALEELAVKSEE